MLITRPNRLSEHPAIIVELVNRTWKVVELGEEKRDVVVTPYEALRRRENAWSQRLKAVSLAAEYPVNSDHAAQILEVIGDYYRKHRNKIHEREALLRRFPAVHVIATTYAASEKYEAGTFWPYLATMIGIDNSQNFQNEWGRAFLDNLNTLGLPTFANQEEEAGTKYVGRILLHSGVPTSSIEDLYRIIIERRRKQTSINAESFVSWAAKRAEDKRLTQVDKPVARFLRFGGIFAVDVTDRIFELLDMVDAGQSVDEIMLPDRFKSKALEMKHSGITLSRGERGDQQSFRPSIVLDPYGLGPLLEMPATDGSREGALNWVVTLDGSPQRFSTSTQTDEWVSSSSVTSVPIPKPIRVASVFLEGHEELRMNVTIVDDSNPLLAFDEDGRLLPSSLPLPSQPVWLLVPGSNSTLVFDGEAKLVTESALPSGWAHWSLSLYDLSNARSVKYQEDGKLHPVKTLSTARIETEPPLANVRTLGGAPVFSKLPKLHLPEGANPESKWEVSIFDSNEELLSRNLIEPDTPESLIWGAIPKPVFGTFTIKVRGPWGRGTSRTLFIAEGLNTTSSPKWRHMTNEGLVPAKVSLDGPADYELNRDPIELNPIRRDRKIRVGTKGRWATLRVEPPHMSVSYQTREISKKPSIRKLTIFTELETHDYGTLILNIAPDASPELTVFSGNEIVQTLSPHIGRNGIHRFELSRLSDTIATYKYLSICLGEDGQVTIATIRPRKLFSSVERADGELWFEECADLPGLAAACYLTRAPWRAPTVIPIENGRAQIPQQLSNAGPMRVSVFVQDPWAPEPLTHWPKRQEATFVDGDGFYESDDPDETSLSSYLAGLSEFPTISADASKIWSVLDTLSGLNLEDRFNQVRADAEDFLSAHPHEAFASLAESTVNSNDIPSRIVQSGLAWSTIKEIPTDGMQLWTNRSAVGNAFFAASIPDWSSGAFESALEVCGEEIVHLREGVDRHSKAGRFDSAAEAFAANPASRKAFVNQIGLIPQGILSPDSRVLAAMALIESLDSDRLHWLMSHARSVAELIEQILEKIGSKQTLQAFIDRKNPINNSDWRALPSISIGFALIARYAARGNPTARDYVLKIRRAWIDLAKAAPQLVTIDLTIAEFLVAAHLTKSNEMGDNDKEH